MRRSGHASCIGEKRYAHKILVGEPEGKIRLGYLRVDSDLGGEGGEEKMKVIMTIELEKIRI